MFFIEIWQDLDVIIKIIAIIMISLSILWLCEANDLKKFNDFGRHHSTEILTTLGICGCFIELALSFRGFDGAKINQSIPIIIGSLKSSFAVSALGICLALIMKFTYALSRKNENINEDNASEKTAQTLNELLSEAKNMRINTSKQLEALNDNFKSFSTHMVENNQKALVEALKLAVQDFNTKITEQFGENFKQLNEAVGELLAWQKQYKESIEVMTASQEQSTQSFTEVVKNSANITSNITQIQIAFSEILRNAQDFKDVSSSLGENIKIAKDEIMLMITGQETLKQVVENMSKYMPEANKQVEDMMGHLKGSGDLLKKSLEEELNRSLATLGEQLTSLSRKFVEDYTPLTEALRKIIEISGKVK